MIDPKAEGPEKLSQARQCYVDASDHYADSRAEMHRASRFYHNSRCEGQWEKEDLRILRESGRPAFTFNVIASKIDTWLGQYKDGKRKAVVAPDGTEDQLLAELLDQLCDAVYGETQMDDLESEVLKQGTIKGESWFHVDVTPDPRNPAWVKIMAYRVSPHDVFLDPGATEADGSDARYVFWAKWLSKGEFTTEYPEHRDEWEKLERGDAYTGEDGSSSSHGEPSWALFDDQDYDETSDGSPRRYFYDRHRKKICVVHCEYKSPYKRLYLVNPETGLAEPISEEAARVVRQRQEDPYDPLSRARLEESWDEIIYTLEFVGSKILWESTPENPYQPYEGFSLRRFCFHWDDEDGVPYGPIRNLFDPQQELNKAKSVSLHHLAQQNKPGMIVETDAVDDKDTFDEQLHTAGETAWVKSGAIGANKIRDIPLPQLSPAVVQREQSALELVDRIAVVETDLGNPAAQQEAYGTVQLRYHKSRLAMWAPVAHFESLQRDIKQIVVESIVSVMPDSQIEVLLGNDDRFVVQQGTVYELETNPQTGQPMPVRSISLRDLRSLRHNIQLETTTENTTLRVLEHQGLVNLFQAGVPIDPEILAANASSSRSMRDRLRQYAKERMAAQQQAEMQQEMQTREHLESMLDVERQKTAETSRHNQAKEILEWQQQLSDEQIAVLKALEAADDAEYSGFMDMVKVLEERQKNRQEQQTRLAIAGSRPRLRALPGGER